MSSSNWRVAADLREIGLAGDQAAAGPGHRPEDVAGGGARGLGRHVGALVPTPLLYKISGHSDQKSYNGHYPKTYPSHEAHVPSVRLVRVSHDQGILADKEQRHYGGWWNQYGLSWLSTFYQVKKEDHLPQINIDRMMEVQQKS